MRSQLILICIPLFFILPAMGQQSLPFEKIPAYPESFTSASVATRMIDALGFRYYWATQGLNSEDLSFRPVPEARSTRETLEHIHGLVRMIYNTHFGIINTPGSVADMPDDELRLETLTMLQDVRTLLSETSPDLSKLNITFPQGEMPYWNLLNGPIADAIYHVGQLVTLRRMSGNPIHPGVDVFRGTVNSQK
jgi:hypothetical protein